MLEEISRISSNNINWSSAVSRDLGGSNSIKWRVLLGGWLQKVADEMSIRRFVDFLIEQGSKQNFGWHSILYLDLLRWLEKIQNIPKWWFHGAVPRCKVKSHLKQIQEFGMSLQIYQNWCPSCGWKNIHSFLFSWFRKDSHMLHGTEVFTYIIA